MKSSTIIRYIYISTILICCYFGLSASNTNFYNPSSESVYEVKHNVINEDSAAKPILNIKISPFRILFGDFTTTSFAIGCGFERLTKNRKTYDIGLYLLLHENISGYSKIFPEYVDKLIGYYFYFDRKKYFLKNKEQCNSPYWSYSFDTYFTFSKPRYALGEISVYRQLSSARINIGIQKGFFESKKFIYDLSLGIGISHLFAYSHSDETIQPLTIPLFDDNYISTYSASNILFPSINLTIRLGYVIK